MDSCHIPLGRPWKYDKEAQYVGRKNVYKFNKGEESYIVTSLLEGEGTQLVGPDFLMVGKK